MQTIDPVAPSAGFGPYFEAAEKRCTTTLLASDPA